MMRKLGGVLSVDLAHRRYSDIGFAYLASRKNKVRLLKPTDLELHGEPSPKKLASSLADFCDHKGISVLLLDGPQGWRYPRSQIKHMRLSERVLNTPGKTGVVGSCKPFTYLPYIKFSIDLFHHLRVEHGWKLLTQDWYEWPGTPWMVESFPTSAWKTVGLPKLPAKSKTTPAQLVTWTQDLRRITGLQLPENPTHDELQATIVLPVGLAITENKPEHVILSGIDPFFNEDGIVLEGWIANPCISHDVGI